LEVLEASGAAGWRAVEGFGFIVGLATNDQRPDDARQFVRSREYAAAIPARDMLAFCDSSSADGIAELQRVIERVQPTGDHLLTKAIYVRRDSKWQPRAA